MRHGKHHGDAKKVPGRLCPKTRHQARLHVPLCSGGNGRPAGGPPGQRLHRRGDQRNRLPRLLRHFRGRCLSQGIGDPHPEKHGTDVAGGRRAQHCVLRRKGQGRHPVPGRHVRRNLYHLQRRHLWVAHGHAHYQFATVRYPGHARNKDAGGGQRQGRRRGEAHDVPGPDLRPQIDRRKGGRHLPKEHCRKSLRSVQALAGGIKLGSSMVGWLVHNITEQNIA
mmetsp:Transcript_2264/g.4859  ORF Transcript_2264/g.4859 Transcript_2264/m.4859 type:complete len:223 (+) Transcript_2264:969-1637(+)